jgi:hypothetical protein
MEYEMLLSANFLDTMESFNKRTCTEYLFSSRLLIKLIILIGAPPQPVP